MDRTVRITIGIIICAAIVGVAAYGSYLPLRKTQSYISTLQGLQSSPANSLSDLETRLSQPLDYPSPIGQEELVRNMANSVLAFIQNGADPTSTSELIAYLNSYYDPILNRGRGMSFGQDLYLEGAVNEIAFVQSGNPAYLEASKKWYSEGHDLGPNRPQPLYGLFDIYRAENDTANAIATGKSILNNWPTDTRIAQALAQLAASSTPVKK